MEENMGLQLLFCRKKRKGKKKRLARSDVETIESVNLPSDNRRSDDAKEGSKHVVSLCGNRDYEVYKNGKRISKDGILSVASVNEPEKKLQNVENELESSMNKMNIEEETLDIVCNIKNRPFSLINTRSLPKVATTYELENFDKHALIIFNHKNIDGHEPRYGTEKDVNALTTTFESFGFEVTTHNDLTKDGLFNELVKFSERDFTHYGCVAVAILTHGSNNGMLRAKDQLYSEIEVINYFKDYSKPTLVTKPKIFIIQACRGTKIMTGVPVFQSDSGKIRKDLSEEDLEPYILPVESDLLILHSSYPGRASHRDTDHGSWFIQTLCKKINTLSPSQDLESIITEVKRAVAIYKEHEEYNKRTCEMNVNKQMPVMTSTLIRKLYLKKFGEKHVEETYVERSRSQSESSQGVVDAASDIPPPPLLVHFGPCYCFLDHFTYMRNCLKHFVEENPDDEAAQVILDMADTLEDTVQFNSIKDRMCKMISKHFMEKAKTNQFYKYLHFYK